MATQRASAQVDDAVFTGHVTIGGVPAPDTLVMYSVDDQDSPAGNSTVTDSSGDYEIWVEGGHTYFLYFANGNSMFDATATQERYIDAGETVYVDVDLNAAPDRTATVMGYVTNASNPAEPVTSGHVLGLRFSGLGGGDSPDYINWTTTDGSGYYEVDVLDGTIMAAVFDAADYYPGMIGPAVALPDSQVWLNISLYPLSFADVNITGVVSDYGTTDPIEGALVEAFGSDMPFARSDTTDVNGEYLISTIHGSGEMRASADGYVSLIRYDMYFSGDMTVDFALRQINAGIYGQVRDAITLAPIEGAQVHASSGIGPNLDMFNDTTTDSGGYFEMDLCDGWWWIGARSPGYGENSTMISLDPTDLIWVDLLLHPESSIVKGYVTDYGTGSPISGATVMLGTEYEDRNVTGTNASGYYEMYCQAGSYQMIFTASGYMIDMQQDYPTAVGPGEVLWVNHTLEAPTVNLFGDVLDAVSLAPLDGAEIGTGSPSPDEPDFFRIVFTTSSGGAYSVMVAPSDTQIMSSELTGYDSFFAFFEVPDVPSLEYDIYMMPEGGVGDEYTIAGYVNDSASDTPIAGAVVMALQGLWNYINGSMTDGMGYYSFNVPTAVLTLRASATGYLPEERLILTQPAGSTLWQNFSLVSHTVPPEIDAAVDPAENVSVANHADMYATVSDEYLNYIGLDILRLINQTGDEAWMEVMESYAYRVGFPGNTLTGIEIAPGVWEVGVWDWPATARAGVYQIHDILETNFLVDVDSYYADSWGNVYVNGWYINTSLLYPVWGTSVFGPDGEFMYIEIGGGPDWDATNDLTGQFWLESDVVLVNTTTNRVVYGTTDAVNMVYVSSMWIETVAVYQSGQHAALFSAVDDASLWNSTVVPFTIDNDPPAADAGTSHSAIVNTTVELNASMSSDNVGITEYKWEFDDGGPVVLYGEVLTYEFTTVGYHEITLTVRDGANLVDSATTWADILEDQRPVADAGADQSVDEDVELTLDGSASSDDLGVVNWTWTFDDGGLQTLYGMMVQHTFNTPGIFEVTLIVQDTAGQYSEPNSTTITVADLTDPVADAGANSTVSVGTGVTLDGSGSYDNSGILVSWTWTFDDDGPQTLIGETASYTFSNPGVFDVTLTVEDGAGLTATDVVTITVVDDVDPVADAGPDQDVTAGDTVTFDGSGSSDNVGVDSWTWTFAYDEEDQELSGASPEFTFDIAGTYTVTLTVADAEGNSDTDTVVIRVTLANEEPVADAGDDETIDEGDTFTFDGSGSSDDGGVANLNFTWTFTYDDETKTLYGVAPEFTFDIAGEYDVVLTVTDEEGLSSSDTMVLTVEEKAGISMMWWAAIGAVAVAVVLVAALAMMRRARKGGSATPPPPEEFEEPGPPEDEEL